MKLYDYPASCNCYKVRLLLATLGQPYERVPVDIFAGETLTAEYGRINPARTTPVLETDDGRYLPESRSREGTMLWASRSAPNGSASCSPSLPGRRRHWRQSAWSRTACRRAPGAC